MLSSSKGSFTRPVNVTASVNSTFDLFDLMCKKHHRTALNPFLNGTKNGVKRVNIALTAVLIKLRCT